jgi:HAE1 family hydrophobic/amphiphilic exporter-1
MALAGFTINIMTLLALSLAVGLLVDDAIVVRENIFRHIEMGKSSAKASVDGTTEVGLAVIATTLTVIAVFGPICFLQGVVGQFFKEFGLTICFAMMISLFDALTIAPMLSAYFAGGAHNLQAPTKNPLRKAVQAFDRFQTRLEDAYVVLIRGVMKHPLKTLALALGIFIGSIMITKYIPKTFLPANDAGEFSVGLDLPPGTSLSAMAEVAAKVDAKVRENKEIATTLLTVGNKDGAANVADIFVQLVPAKERKKVNTTIVKDRLREQLQPFAFANPIVKDNDMVGGGMRPFTMNISGPDLEQLEKYSAEVYKWLRNHPGLKDVDMSYRPGKPEFQVEVDQTRAKILGISTSLLGLELRTLVEGATPAIFRENGREYDVRVRLQEDQRDLKKRFDSTYIPNINMSLVRLAGVAKGTQTTGPATINRQDRQRYIAVMGDITPGGVGIGGVMQDIEKAFKSGELKLPEGVGYRFVGQAENFQELIFNMLMAAALGILFIYLVLSSLYESFITPFTIMSVLPLAMCGAFYALWITRASLDLFSMIGCIMLLGVATKNSILLVDYTVQKMDEGLPRDEAILEAGRTRLRPILMTTVALIAGMLPLAIGLNEASRQRTSMGIAVIGGLISSTLLTLIVVPAVYSYIDRLRLFTNRIFHKISSSQDVNKELAAGSLETRPKELSN